MSLNRLRNDPCTYTHDLKQSLGSADYMLNEPNIECRTCFNPDPNFRMANQMRRSTGDSVCSSLIDMDSELKNITRPATNCPRKKYLPGMNSCTLQHFPDCESRDFISKEDTRLSNPGCTLRCTGWNRWEWLCQNPQDKALASFDYNINNRTIVKDNHRPCVPTLDDPYNAWPAENNKEVKYNGNCGEPVKENYSAHWRNIRTYEKYV